MIDHIDGNGLSNRRENLLFVTMSENAVNSVCTWGRSKYRGVSWRSQTGKWRVQVAKDGKRKYVGDFLTEEEAANAYREAIQELFGDVLALSR